MAFSWRNEPGWPVEYVSDNVAHMLGYKPAEFRSGSINYISIIHPDDLERVQKEVQENSAEQEVSNFTHEPYRIKKKDGQYIWVEDNTYIKRKDGKITFYEGIIRNITELIESQKALVEKNEEITLQNQEYISLNEEYISSIEELKKQKDLIQAKNQALAEAEERYKFLSNVTFEGIFLHQHGIAVDINDAVTRLTGYTRDDLIGKNLLEFIATPEDQKLARYNMAKKYAEPYQIHFKCKDESVIVAEIEARNTKFKGENVRIVAFRDITERVKMQQAFEENRKVMASILDNMHDGLYSVDVKTFKLLRINQATEEIFGVPKSYFEENPKGYLNFVHPDDLKIVKASMDEIYTKKSGKWIYRIVKPDGEVRWVSDRAVLIEDEAGNPLRIDCYFNDITEEKKAEENIHFQTLLLNQIQDLITATDLNGIITYVNDAECRLHNKPRKELIGKSIHEFGEDSKIGATQDEIIEQTINNGSWRGEVANILDDGTRLILDSRIQVIYDKNGQPAGMVGISTDITERKQYEQHLKEKNEEYAALNEEFAATNDELREQNEKIQQLNENLQKSEKKFRSFVESANDIIYTLSLEGEFTYVSPNWEQMVGHEIHEVIGSNFSDFVHPDDVEKCWNFLQRLIDTGERQSGVEYRVRHKNHSYRWHTSNASPLKDSEGNLVAYLGIARDLTDRINTEHALKESEEKFKSLFNTASDAIFIHDMAGNFIEVNETATSQLGYTRDELLNMSIYDIDTTDEAPHTPLRLNQIREEGRIFLDVKHKTKKGKEIDVEINAVIIQYGGKEAILSIARNVTQRKKVEVRVNKYLKELEIISEVNSKLNYANTYDKVLEVIGEEIHELNPDSYLILSSSKIDNPNLLEIRKHYGFKKMADKAIQVLGRDPRRMVFDVNEMTEAERENYTKGKFIRIEEGAYSLLNRKFPKSICHSLERALNIESIYSMGFSHKGIPTGGVVVLLRNSKKITEKKLVEQLVRQASIKLDQILAREELKAALGKVEKSEKRYRDLIENQGEGIALTDVAEQFIFVNPAAEKIFGVQKGALAGKSLKSFTSPEEFNKLLAETNKRRQGIESTYETDIIRPDGEKRTLLVTATPRYNEHNEFINTFAIFRDISERKKIEEELKLAKEKAEESDRLKSAFLANMSHEIRTPMNGIMGFAQLLKHKSISEEKKQHFINIIHSSSHYLLQLINDIIDTAKIESNQITISKVDFDLNEMLRDVDGLIRESSMLKSKPEVQLVLDASMDEPFYINTDDTRLKQIISNLLSNAIKFTDQGTVRFGYHHDQHKTMIFYVEDTGIGIPGDKLQTIWERFSQLETGNDRLYEGTGLGLAISKGLADMLGGKIWVESEPGIGSTFYVSLPYVPAEKVSPHKQGQKLTSRFEDSWQGKRILIAEDQESIYLYLTEILKPTKAEVIWVKDGQKAIDYVDSEERIDVVLMDIKMPELDGYEATRIIKERYPRLPVIAQTAFALQEEKHKYLKAGFDEYITKPINPNKLLKILQQFLMNETN